MTVRGLPRAPPSAIRRTAASRLVRSARANCPYGHPLWVDSGVVTPALVRADRRRNDSARTAPGSAIRDPADGSVSPRPKRGRTVPTDTRMGGFRSGDAGAPLRGPYGPCGPTAAGMTVSGARGFAMRDLADGSVSPRPKRGRTGFRSGDAGARAGRPPPE